MSADRFLFGDNHVGVLDPVQKTTQRVRVNNNPAPKKMFQIVQCFKCEAYQVQERRKETRSGNTSWRSRGAGLGSAKFTCRLCNEKQSERSLFGVFSSGKDARHACMDLNKRRGAQGRGSASPSTCRAT